MSASDLPVSKIDGTTIPLGTNSTYDLIRERENHPFWQLLLAPILLIITGGIVSLVSPEEGLFEQTNWTAYITLTAAVLAAVLGIGGYQLIVSKLGKRPVYELNRRGALKEFGGGILLGALLISFPVAVLASLGMYRIVDFSWDSGFILGLAIGIAAGFCEEIFARGFVLRITEKWLGSWGALTVSSIIFGLLHLGNPGITFLGIVFIALEAGIMLGAAYILTRRLWFAIGIHLGWNFVQGGVWGSDISGSGSGRGLFAAEFSGPDWLTGGTMGLEGSYLSLVTVVAGIVMLVIASRRGYIIGPVWRKQA